MTGNFRLKDVAALADVSTSTVSRVFRGVAVLPELEERVREAAARLGYQPNGLAQALRAGRLGVVGLIVPDVSNPWFAELAREIEVVARAHGHGVVLCNSDNRRSQEEECLDLLWNRRVDGVILVSVRGEPPRALPGRAVDWPVVAFDESCAAPTIDVVTSDNRAGMDALVEHLVGTHALRRLSVIAPQPPSLVAAAERLGAVRAVLARRRLPPPEVVEGDLTYEAGRRAAEEILRRYPDSEAIVGLNDAMALGAMRAVAEAGLSVPRDIAVVGFDDMSVATWVAAPLTTVRQDLAGLGRSAYRLVSERMNDPQLAQRKVVVPTELRVRQSCGCRAPLSENPDPYHEEQR
jgi:DNA-binding LacI/PurR family transcriptional regulator